MDATLQLPTELLFEITQAAAQVDLVALCCVDRRVGAVATNELYRRVELWGEDALVGFLATLEMRPEYCELVRGLILDFADNIDIDFAETFARRVDTLVGYATALEKLTNLRELYSTFHPIPAFLPSGCDAFPQLRKLSANLGPNLMQLLAGRDALEELRILGGDSVCLDAETKLFATSYAAVAGATPFLPALKEFHGPAGLATFLLPGAAVARPIIAFPSRPRTYLPFDEFSDSAGEPLWYVDMDDPAQDVFAVDMERCLRAVAQSAVPVVHLTAHVGGWDALEPALVAKYLPELEFLMVGNVLEEYLDEDPLVDKFDMVLPEFKKLEVIVIAHDPEVDVDDWECLELTAAYEKHIQEVCPTLNEFIISRRALDDLD